MDVKDVFVGSEQALTRVVDQIGDHQWTMAMPADFQTRGGERLALREVINYHAYDDAWVPEVLAGKTIAEVGDAHDGDLLGDDPKASWHRIVDTAVAAVKGCDDLDRTVHLTYGDWPAREYLRHIISFRALRAIDIARVIGVADRLPDDLVQGVWNTVAPDAEQWRTMGVFGPAVEVPDHADLQSKLLGITGRQP